jgi:hypothetical protein
MRFSNTGRSFYWVQAVEVLGQKGQGEKQWEYFELFSGYVWLERKALSASPPLLPPADCIRSSDGGDRFDVIKFNGENMLRCV